MPVKVHGAIALRKALRQFAPDLAKETNKEIASFIKPIVKNARGYMPSNADAPSGWLKRDNAKGKWATRYYDAGLARRGITYKATPSRPNANGFQALASIYNKSAAGAIYETAGRKSGITGNFTPRLGGEIKGRNQMNRGRGIFRAFEEDRGKATAGIVRAIETAKAKFQAKTGGLK